MGDHPLSGNGQVTPARARKNVIALCKAIIKMCEGPGEIDTLVHETCDKLGDLLILIRDAHDRAVAEREAQTARLDKFRAATAEIPRMILLKELRDLLEEDAAIAPEDWSTLEDIE